MVFVILVIFPISSSSLVVVCTRFATPSSPISSCIHQISPSGRCNGTSFGSLYRISAATLHWPFSAEMTRATNNLILLLDPKKTPVIKPQGHLLGAALAGQTPDREAEKADHIPSSLSRLCHAQACAPWPPVQPRTLRSSIPSSLYCESPQPPFTAPHHAATPARTGNYQSSTASEAARRHQRSRGQRNRADLGTRRLCCVQLASLSLAISPGLGTWGNGKRRAVPRAHFPFTTPPHAARHCLPIDKPAGKRSARLL